MNTPQLGPRLGVPGSPSRPTEDSLLALRNQVNRVRKPIHTAIVLSSLRQCFNTGLGSSSLMMDMSKRTWTTSYVPHKASGGVVVASSLCIVTFLGKEEGCGNWSSDMSKPSSRAEDGAALANVQSQMPVPVPTSATFQSSLFTGIEGWRVYPKASRHK